MPKPKEFKPPKVLEQTTTLLPVTSIEQVNQKTVFRTKDGGYLDLVAIDTKDLDALSSYDIEFNFISMSAFFKAYQGDVKLICMHYPVDTYSQMEAVDRLIERSEKAGIGNPDELETERRILENIHRDFETLEFYLMFWAEDENDYSEKYRTMESFLFQKSLASPLDGRKKIAILRKLGNLPSSLAQTNFGEIPLGIPPHKTYNPWLLFAIQPQGGVSFQSERIVKTGDGYEICIHLYDFKDKVEFGWLRPILIQQSAVSAIDIASADKYKAMESIHRSLEEQTSRYAQARYATERIDAQRVYEQLHDLYESMSSMGEVLKYVDIRIFLFDKDEKALRQRTANVITNLESRGFKATVFLEENGWEWQSLFLPYTGQQRLLNRRNCRSLTSETLAVGYPFHYSSLSDPYGQYWGMTPTDGLVLFDPWCKNERRLSYCAVILGNMGAGKSTTLKKLIKGDAIKGNYIRGFATNREYEPLIAHYGGIQINLDGTDGVLNILQIYKTDETEEGSFLKHLAKVQTWYSFLCPEADTYDLSELAALLKMLYQKHLGYPGGVVGQKQITGLEPHSYPILSDLLAVIQEELYQPGTKKRREGISETHFDRVERIELVIRSIVENYGKVFNGHSNLRSFADEQIVFFNVANLKSYGDGVFDAQLFSALNLLWDNLLHVGEPQFVEYNNGNLAVQDVRKYMIYMDEAHNFVNAQKLTAVDYLGKYVRESRKFFGGITFASQSINDFLPEGSDTVGIDAIRKLFSLAQYKWLFQQNQDAHDALLTAFRNELPDYYLHEISRFPAGDCVLLTGDNVLRFHVSISDAEKRLFSGGA